MKEVFHRLLSENDNSLCTSINILYNIELWTISSGSIPNIVNALEPSSAIHECSPHRRHTCSARTRSMVVIIITELRQRQAASASFTITARAARSLKHPFHDVQDDRDAAASHRLKSKHPAHQLAAFERFNR